MAPLPTVILLTLLFPFSSASWVGELWYNIDCVALGAVYDMFTIATELAYRRAPDADVKQEIVNIRTRFRMDLTSLVDGGLPGNPPVMKIFNDRLNEVMQLTNTKQFLLGYDTFIDLAKSMIFASRENDPEYADIAEVGKCVEKLKKNKTDYNWFPYGYGKPTLL